MRSLKGRAATTQIAIHHFRKRTSGRPQRTDLSWAGFTEWADTWILLCHREEPRPDDGEYRLGMIAGTRQAGEHAYNVDVDVSVDPELNSTVAPVFLCDKVPYPESYSSSGDSFYTFVDPDAPIQAILDWFWVKEPDPVKRPVRVMPVSTDADVARAEGVLSELEHANKGERNSMLLWASGVFAEIVDDGALTLQQATDHVTDTAHNLGFGRLETRATIRSGMKTRADRKMRSLPTARRSPLNLNPKLSQRRIRTAPAPYSALANPMRQLRTPLQQSPLNPTPKPSQRRIRTAPRHYSTLANSMRRLRTPPQQSPLNLTPKPSQRRIRPAPRAYSTLANSTRGRLIS
jgi:hypothetical protein